MRCDRFAVDGLRLGQERRDVQVAMSGRGEQLTVVRTGSGVRSGATYVGGAREAHVQYDRDATRRGGRNALVTEIRALIPGDFPRVVDSMIESFGEPAAILEQTGAAPGEDPVVWFDRRCSVLVRVSREQLEWFEPRDKVRVEIELVRPGDYPALAALAAPAQRPPRAASARETGPRPGPPKPKPEPASELGRAQIEARLPQTDRPVRALVGREEEPAAAGTTAAASAPETGPRPGPPKPEPASELGRAQIEARPPQTDRPVEALLLQSEQEPAAADTSIVDVAGARATPPPGSDAEQADEPEASASPAEADGGSEGSTVTRPDTHTAPQRAKDDDRDAFLPFTLDTKRVPRKQKATESSDSIPFTLKPQSASQKRRADEQAKRSRAARTSPPNRPNPAVDARPGQPDPATPPESITPENRDEPDEMDAPPPPRAIVFVPPVKTKHVNPRYPSLARNVERDKRVVLELEVLETGRVGNVYVLEVTVPRIGLERSAMEAVRRWVYEPATRDGVAVSAPVSVTIAFE